METADFPVVPGVEHRFVEVNGFRMHVAEAGQGEPLLMLHGWPQHWYMWRNQIPALAKHYRLIMPDHRGFGWSDVPARHYDKEQLAADAVALLDKLGIARVRLMAHDWGGWAGFILCMRHPERVSRFLVLNIPHLYQRPDSRLLALWRLSYQLLLSAPWLAKFLLTRTNMIADALRNTTAGRPFTPEEAAIYGDRLRDPRRARASIQLYRTFVLRELFPVMFGRYRGLRLRPKTKLLFGVDDTNVSPRLLKGYEPYADDMQIELVQRCAHFIAEEQPELVTQRALEFFGATDIVAKAG